MKLFLATALRLIRPLLFRIAVDLRGMPDEVRLDDEIDVDFCFVAGAARLVDLTLVPSFRLDALTRTVLPVLTVEDFDGLFELDDERVEERVVVDRTPERLEPPFCAVTSKGRRILTIKAISAVRFIMRGSFGAVKMHADYENAFADVQGK